VLEQLSRADASITDLAGKFHMTLTGMKKHVGVLERAALVTTEKAGARQNLQAWHARAGRRGRLDRAAPQLWSARFDALDKIVEHLKSKEKQMPDGKEGSPAAMNRTAVERKSDRELVVTRTFNAPAHIVFEAWSKPELFKRWWVPKSVACRCSRATWMCAPGARIASSSVIRPSTNRWRSSARTEK